MGEVRKRGHIYWIRYYRNGVRHEETSHSRKKTDAERLLRLREGDIARGVPLTAQVGRLRFEEAAREIVTDYRINKRRSIKDVERRLRLHLTPFFGGRRMAAITTAEINRFIAHRQDQAAANAQINLEFAVVRRMFVLAVDAGTLLHRPRVRMLKLNNIRSGFFERQEFEAVRSLLPVPLQSLVTFAYLTGWRVNSEIFPLEWRQVDRQAGMIRLEPGSTKNDDGRLFPFSEFPELAEAMETQWAEKRRIEQERGIVCRWVFHRDGRRILSLYKAWRSACVDAGYPGRIPHDFRRTAVRNLVRAGVPERVAMQLTGHKTRSVFDRYDIVNEADLQEAVRKLAASCDDSHRTGRIVDMSPRR